jgi:hypothetical protein
MDGTGGKKKCVTLTMPHKLETGDLKVEIQRELIALKNTASSTIHDSKGQRDQLRSFMASNENVKGLTM